MLVSLSQCKMRLRIDQDIEDSDLILLIEGASSAVLNYLKTPQDFLDSSGEPSTDTNGDPIVPAEIVNATLLLTGILYKNRNGDEAQIWQQGFLPAPITALLYPLRDPASA